MTYKIVMENLLCTNCAGKIEKSVRNMEQVEEANYNLAAQIMTVTTNEKQNDDEFLKSITKIVDSIEDGVTVYYKNKKKIEKKTDYARIVLLIGLVVFFVAFFMDSVWGMYIGYLMAANKIIRKAVNSILNKTFFDENTLMFIATLAAFYIHEYVEGIAVLVFYSVGEYFQERAVKKSKAEIENLVNLKVDTITVVKGLKEYKKEPEELEIGDVMLIPTGKMVPVDGVVVRGTSSVDTAQITGESVPVDVEKGSSVISGSINTGAVLEVKVNKTYENSTLYKIINLIENSTANKSQTEQFITKFARYYTPAVAIIAAMLVLIPTLINQANFNEYLYRGAIFLVISCPCALVLSIPLSYFAGIGKNASLGVLYKGSNHLETLTKVKHLFTDKTGTLTKGNFEVTDYSSEEVLKLAASLEKYSTHPIANAITSYYKSEVYEVSDIEELAGYGLKAKFQLKQLLVGNKKLMNDFGFEVPEINGTVLYVATDSYLGYILIKDQIKDSSHIAINGFKSLGISVHMLTGDKDDVAKEVATELGIDYKSGLLPDEKLDYMDSFKETSMFIGDGINDAPALANADVGISMGAKGSDLAIEVADVIVMDDSLNTMYQSMKVAFRTKKIVLQNIVFALGIKLAFLALGGVGLSSMWMAIFADVGVSLIAVLNSLRILRK